MLYISGTILKCNTFPRSDNPRRATGSLGALINYAFSYLRLREGKYDEMLFHCEI